MAAGKRAKTPTYPLEDVIRLSKRDGSRILTGSAEGTARGELGLTRDGVFRIVANLRATDFYKTMPSEKCPGTFQDVYRPIAPTPLYQGGVQIYCKVQITTGLVVVSFKLR